ncbi:glycerol-3-phosphate 1-O-acyltransferase PlsY [Peptoniphilus harei]|uniref:Glycerol-3-phosphate acyltransferase n=1 Tax=Peptoniphilus harei TaxID=54005 RepID=A0A2X1ZX19_9FIRM|nr:glycerol-3-phosphate 1-O-acyltransferase PlsY [Peptoniphilus harei]MBS6534350.1 glycerol-3-phosphate 1-O-acyltransferase PlsY [Peptoniphilus harei]MDU3086433.1 glycerol-3-phosphate 1-O-acyltransferase PlsY [Peptoniphilus harei]QQT90915.1 glycerol-3-phosphate 1-O-acyltransferase PlsY [Peptoniphilus harei]SPY48535.1 G3P acyltransferase [Peptoniphilus harei]
MNYILTLLISYFVGTISGSYIIGNLFLNKDIRKYGSGNAGTTNAMRVLGKKAGVLTFLIDFLKGALVTLIIRRIFGDEFVPLAILGAVIGHDFPFYMKFKGGKGVATTLGALALFNFPLTLICYVVWVLGTVLTKMVSVGSILFFVSIIIVYSFMSNLAMSNILIIDIIALIGIIRHKDNIKRIIAGNENKIGGRK